MCILGGYAFPSSVHNAAKTLVFRMPCCKVCMKINSKPVTLLQEFYLWHNLEIDIIGGTSETAIIYFSP